jgi:hypothetical protein
MLRCGRPAKRLATALWPVWVPQALGGSGKVQTTCSKTKNEVRLNQLLKCCASLTWWSLRGGRTRSHSEHGRETPLRQWYSVSRRGRVGRCQVCKTQHIFSIHETKRPLKPISRAAHKRPFRRLTETCSTSLTRDKSPSAICSPAGITAKAVTPPR